MKPTEKIELFENEHGNLVGIAPENIDTPSGWKRITYRRQRGAGMARGNSEQRVLTPPEFLDAVRARFGQPYIDLAASDGDQIAGVTDFIDPGADSLKIDWGRWVGRAGLAPKQRLCWLNPPFSKMRPWVEKCVKHREELNILLLCPASVGSGWFRDLVVPHARVHIIGRLKFLGHETPFPKDLCVAHFGPNVIPGQEYWDWKRKSPDSVFDLAGKAAE